MKHLSKLFHLRFPAVHTMKNAVVVAMGVLSLVSVVSCTGGGGEISGGSGSGSSDSSKSGRVTVSGVYPTSTGSTWTKVNDSNGRIHFKDSAISFAGTCARGVAAIKLFNGTNAFSDPAVCSENGSFVLTKTFSSSEQGDLDLSVSAVDTTGATSADDTVGVKIRMDLTAPEAPTITTPSVTPYTYFSALAGYTISGTVASDVVSIQGPGGVPISLTNSSWSYDVTLSASSATDYSFTATDLAGNTSVAATVSIAWQLPFQILVNACIQGNANTPDSVASYSAESAISSYGVASTDTNASGMTLQTGLNTIINEMRAQ